MATPVERDNPKWQQMTADAKEVITKGLRDLVRWLYRQLRREYEFQISDEQVGEAINVNDYTFAASSRRFGRPRHASRTLS